MNKLSFIILTLISLTAFSQTKLRPVEELIDEKDSGWPLVTEWIKSAKNKVEILSVDNETAKDALYKTQVTTRSPMGAIIYETGGLVIDNGWIRILGSGNNKLKRSLPNWNLGKGFKDFGQQSSFLLVADDAIGGFFILNGGGLGKDLGKIYYFAPDTLEFEPLNLTYTEFLNFCFNNNLDKFYKGYRWKNWNEDVLKLSYDDVFNFFPCLWSKEGKVIENISRKEVPIEEQYTLNLDFRKQLGIDK
jgi:hypothetical protein